METLEQRLFAIEEAVGTLPPMNQSLHSKIALLRDELKSLKMDMVLRVPVEKLRELHKDPTIEDTLSMDEKLFLIQYHRPMIDQHIEELDEMERLSKLVFDSDSLVKIPDDSVLDDVKKSMEGLKDELEQAHEETINFLVQQSKILKETADAWMQVKNLARPKPQV
uniref:Dynactin subunit 3 n=1 Tax=Panagrolaimus sp. ES5 TaxID=591445 RepID=A0AC34EZS8_9BILA